MLYMCMGTELERKQLSTSFFFLEGVHGKLEDIIMDMI